MMLEDDIDEDSGKLRGGDGCFDGCEVNHFAETVHTHKNGIQAILGARKLSDEVHADLLPPFLRDWQGLQQAS